MNEDQYNITNGVQFDFMLTITMYKCYGDHLYKHTLNLV